MKKMIGWLSADNKVEFTDNSCSLILKGDAWDLMMVHEPAKCYSIYWLLSWRTQNSSWFVQIIKSGAEEWLISCKFSDFMFWKTTWKHSFLGMWFGSQFLQRPTYFWSVIFWPFRAKSFIHTSKSPFITCSYFLSV